ncbi:hypothetical protein D1AOALGA4SA_5853 [Olavius algarvensis Delta 1 endosymbiont]|nr:hypothetical protein D1AOALGA4SA_5853 [Olavius algarvensis Delta 1 endosymbiont]
MLITSLIIGDTIIDCFRIADRALTNLQSKAFIRGVNLLLIQYTDLKDELGIRRNVRNGFTPERNVESGIGTIPVKDKRIRIRRSEPSRRIRFSPKPLPPYL